MNKFKKLSSKCTSQALSANIIIAKLLRPREIVMGNLATPPNVGDQT
jgi:hypothetical protein